MKKIYQYEVGILLDKTHPAYEEYSNVWDKKHGFYDEDWGVMLDYGQALDFVADYVYSSTKNTYGIISEFTVPDEEYDDYEKKIDENGYCEDYEMDYDMKNVIKFYIKE